MKMDELCLFPLSYKHTFQMSSHKYVETLGQTLGPNEAPLQHLEDEKWSEIGLCGQLGVPLGALSTRITASNVGRDMAGAHGTPATPQMAQ